jgi:hypothetical protein
MSSRVTADSRSERSTAASRTFARAGIRMTTVLAKGAVLGIHIATLAVRVGAIRLIGNDLDTVTAIPAEPRSFAHGSLCCHWLSSSVLQWRATQVAFDQV